MVLYTFTLLPKKMLIMATSSTAALRHQGHEAAVPQQEKNEETMEKVTAVFRYMPCGIRF